MYKLYIYSYKVSVFFFKCLFLVMNVCLFIFEIIEVGFFNRLRNIFVRYYMYGVLVVKFVGNFVFL